MSRNAAVLPQRLAQCRKVARTAAAEAETGQAPLDVGAALQPLAQGLAQLWAVERIPTASSRSAIAAGSVERGREMIGEEAGAARGYGPIDRRGEAALTLAREGCHQFEIAAGRGVDLHDRSRHDLPRWLQMRRPPLFEVNPT